MNNTVVLVDEVAGRKGAYALPESLAFFTDEPMDSLETIGRYKKEQGKVKVGGDELAMDVYVQTLGGERYPYVLVSDLEGHL